MARKRKDPRREITRTALLEVSEELFGEKGVENVSLREIGDAICSDNNAVVSYYFGSKAGLLRAIYEFRVPMLEARRAKLLEQVEDMGLGNDMVSILYVMWAPIFEQRNANGKPSFAKFLASNAHTNEVSIVSLSRRYPVTRALADRLHSLGDLTQAHFWRRLRLTSMMMIHAIEDAFALEEQGRTKRSVDTILLEALQAAELVLGSPVEVRPELRRLSRAAKKSLALSESAH